MKFAAPTLVLLLAASCLALDTHDAQHSMEPRFKATSMAALKNQLAKARCEQGYPMLVETQKLPEANRAVGDPCATDAQCESGKCACQADGSKQCERVGCQIGNNFVPVGQDFADCTSVCTCSVSGPECVSACPVIAVDCINGLVPVEHPPAPGECCSTTTCECPSPDGNTFPIGGSFSDCTSVCQCSGEGISCVSRCPPTAIDCGGLPVVTIPPAEGECCETQICGGNITAVGGGSNQLPAGEPGVVVVPADGGGSSSSGTLIGQQGSGTLNLG